MNKNINNCHFQIIKNVLDDISNSQINLASEAARTMVSDLISAALKTKGSYKEYTDYELDEQKARASWVCGICGKSTFEVEDDYLVHPKLHLGCALEEEANKIISEGVEIKTYWDENDKEKRKWECKGWICDCGGTHVSNTKEIGAIRLKRKNIGGGKERIEVMLKV